MKTILITGAGSGIGKDVAFALARRGHKVIATTETDSQAELLGKESKDTTISMEVLKLDITNASDREKIAVYDLDVLLNNAAIGESGSLSEVPIDRIRRNFEVNVFAPIEVTQLALKGMMKKEKGTVIFMSSLAGRLPIQFLNPYGMTKFALSGGVAALRKEMHRVAKNVHITLIEPGPYATGFNQRAFATKYVWMNERSYFNKLIPTLIQEDDRFTRSEEKSTASIVAKIIEAVEADKPKLRYVAPWYQGAGVWLLRIMGM